MFEDRPSPRPDVIEVEVLAFLALTLEMVQTGGVLDEMEQLCCSFYGQTAVRFGYNIPRFLHLMSSGKNGVDRMDESHCRLDNMKLV